MPRRELVINTALGIGRSGSAVVRDDAAAVRSVVQSDSGVRFLLGLVILLAMALFVATPSPASAAGSTSTICSGYAACSQGSFTTHGYQNHSGSSYWTMYPGDNCTNYVAFVESTAFGVSTPTYDLGDGGLWSTAAAQHGVLVNHTPSVGSVAVWSGANSGMPGEGHVAVVEAVGPSQNYIVISQQHMLDDPEGYDWSVIAQQSSANQWEQWPTSFIHFPSASNLHPAVALARVLALISTRTAK
jgi:surface antigen